MAQLKDGTVVNGSITATSFNGNATTATSYAIDTITDLASSPIGMHKDNKENFIRTYPVGDDKVSLIKYKFYGDYNYIDFEYDEEYGYLRFGNDFTSTGYDGFLDVLYHNNTYKILNNHAIVNLVESTITSDSTGSGEDAQISCFIKVPVSVDNGSAITKQFEFEISNQGSDILISGLDDSCLFTLPSSSSITIGNITIDTEYNDTTLACVLKVNGKIVKTPYTIETTSEAKGLIFDFTLVAVYDIAIVQPEEGGHIEVVYNGESHTSSFETMAGESITINFILEEGYRVKNIVIGGNTYTSLDDIPDSITINANTDITMECELDTISVDLTIPTGIEYVSINGTRYTSSQTIEVSPGQYETIIQASDGYVITGLSGIASNSYDVSSMTQKTTATYNYSADTSLSITVQQLNITLTITQSVGGTIAVNGSTSNTTIPAGQDFTVSITPDDGYQFSYVDIDGTKYYTGNTIPSEVLTTTYKDKSITAGFTALRTVTLDQTKHATLSIQGYTPEADGTYKIPDGETITVTAIPEDGYEVTGINKIPN